MPRLPHCGGPAPRRDLWGETGTGMCPSGDPIRRRRCPCHLYRNLGWHSFPSVLFLLVVVAVVAVRALAPPHPDFFSDFESVHEMRRRLNITYGYTTKHLHSEQCRHLSEEDCERYDTHFGEERERRRRLVRDPARRHLNPATGEWRGLVLLARFPEHAGKDLAPKSYVEEMFNGRGTSAVNLAGSVSEFYYYHSLKQLTITWDVIDWDTAPQGERYYSHDVGGKAGPEVMQELLSWKLEKLDLEGFDFSPYDKDMDFVLDHLVVLHSGISAEMGNIPCGEKYLERIWSQGTPAMAAIPYVTPTSLYSIGGYAIGSAIGVVGNCEGDPYWDMGITAHEIGHTFYLVDTYDDDASEGYVKIGGLANHDIMANAYGWNRDPFFPSHMSPFSREAAGWLTPIEITKSGLYAAQSAQISGSVYRIRHGFPDGEYLLIENRQIIKWDADRPDGASGFVIFHVDEKANGMKERSWPGKEGWPKEHYMIHVLQADGNYDIEKGNNLGDIGDFWKKGMVLGPTDTWPNTNSYQGGVVKKTGIKITVMSDSGFIMLFKVEGLGNDGNFAPSLVAVDPIDIEGTVVDQGGGGGLVDVPGSDSSPDPHTPGSTIAWVLGLLGGVAATLGVALFFFV